MAEVLANSIIAKDRELLSRNIQIKSAGTIDFGPRQATYAARQVMSEKGLDLDTHESKHINKELCEWADLILVMENEHKQYLQSHYPYTDGKVHLLSEFAGEEGDIADPLAAGIETYRRCSGHIESLVTEVMKRIT
jgi:protein-tyrosine phosphatase